MSIHATTTVADLVTERPARARVFEELGIDYCCGGKVPLADACAERGLDPAAVASRLDAVADGRDREEERDWRAAPLEELCRHIVDVHHGYLRTALPRVGELAGKVARAHGDEAPELLRVRDAFDRLRLDLDAHTEQEEAFVFPAVLRLAFEGDDGHLARSLRVPLELLEREHDEAGAGLAELRALTSDYDQAAARCNTHRALLEALAALESDLHRHVHEENNVLFPRILAAAAA